MEEIVSHINYEGGRGIPIPKKEKICGRLAVSGPEMGIDRRDCPHHKKSISVLKNILPGASLWEAKPGEKSSRFCAWGHFLLHIVPQCTDKVKIAASSGMQRGAPQRRRGGGGRL